MFNFIFPSIKTIVEKTTEILGIEDCGCSRRKDFLNDLISFTPTKNLQHEDSLKEGKYLVLNNFILTYNKESYCYQKGDKIFITKDDPKFNSFEPFYKLGVIKNE